MAEQPGTKFIEIRSADRHGSGSQAQSSDGTGTDGHMAIYASGELTDGGIPVTAAQIQQESLIWSTDSGTANAYVVTLTPTPTITVGSEIVFRAANSNTGASILTVNGQPSAQITKNGSNSLIAGDITAGQIITAKFDGANYQIVSPSTSTGPSGTTISNGIPLGEVPGGTLNGSNTQFTLQHPPIAMMLFLNGILQLQGIDFGLQDSTIYYAVAPLSDDWHLAFYSHS